MLRLLAGGALVALYDWLFDRAQECLFAAFTAAVVHFPCVWLLIRTLNRTWLDAEWRAEGRLSRLF